MLGMLLRFAVMTVVGVVLGLGARHAGFVDWPVIVLFGSVGPWIAFEASLRLWRYDAHPADACQFCGDPAHGSLIRTGRGGRRKGRPIRYCLQCLGPAIERLGRR